jgi:hypothetical protein
MLETDWQDDTGSEVAVKLECTPDSRSSAIDLTEARPLYEPLRQSWRPLTKEPAETPRAFEDEDGFDDEDEDDLEDDDDLDDEDFDDFDDEDEDDYCDDDDLEDEEDDDI